MFGLFQAPYYAFSQTMMAELTPPGFDNMVCLEVKGRCLILRVLKRVSVVLRPLRPLKPRVLDDRP